MPFSTPLAVAIFFTLWWVILLATLPLGVRSPEEEGIERPPGTDPGAPAAPQLWRKAGLTTILTVIVFTLVTLTAKYAGLEP